MRGKQAVALGQLAPRDVPERLRPEFYFDFAAHPFAHRGLFQWEGVNSVVTALGAIGAYAKDWLRRELPLRAKGAQVLEDNLPGSCQTVGRFRVVLEPGALCRPAHVIGSPTSAGPSPAGSGTSSAGAAPPTLHLGPGAKLVGATVFLDAGDISIGGGTTVEPGVGLKGPTIIGRDGEIRQGAYLRGDCVVGDGAILRGELKNVVLMDEANFPHPSYLGDSIVGYRTHFGNQATSANLGIFAGILERSARPNLVVEIDGISYDLGRSKMGVIMGDYSQVGCNAVADPGTFLGPYTIVYSLTRITKGFYGPREVLKNKPLEKGVVERAPLQL